MSPRMSLLRGMLYELDFVENDYRFISNYEERERSLLFKISVSHEYACLLGSNVNSFTGLRFNVERPHSSS